MQSWAEKYKSIETFLLPILVILVTVGTGATIGRIILANIISAAGMADQLQAQNTILAAKKQFLGSVDSEALAEDVQVTVVAVPGQDSTLAALSTVRLLASENGMKIDKIQVGGSAGKEGEIGKSTLSFEIGGPLAGVVSLLDKLQAAAPITKLSKVGLAAAGGDVSAELDITAFWSELPTTLPAADSPLADLTASEREILAQLKSLRRARVSGIIPQAPEGRTNPF